MSKKITLGQRPKSFKPVPVKFQMPDGTEGQITATFKYFTKTESGKLIDALIAEAKAKFEASEKESEDEAKTVSMEALMGKTRDQNAAYLLKVLDAWDVDATLGLDTLQQLDNEIPSASAAIMDAFVSAAQAGKLGN